MRFLKRVWKFIWEDDSILSWIINIILAFVLVKFVIYPGFGLLLGTEFPVVAVVSGSMEHNNNFDSWWLTQQKWYVDNGIDRETFMSWPFKDGFNKGDIMILKGENAENIKLGDVIVFNGASRDPIIHRVVKKYNDNNKIFLQTKGDHNSMSFPELGEEKISEDRIIGKAFFRIPFLGWVKIIFVTIVDFITDSFGR